jgi:branched-chain amino acid aminotransferase
MAPTAITPTTHTGEQDVDLTSMAIEHQLNEKILQANGNSNGTTNGHKSTVQALDASKLTYTFTKSPREVPAPGVTSLNDSTICTDHMVTATWTAKAGWGTPELKPYGPLSLMPTASVLHYATECFEGLKAYRGFDGKLRLFRPDCNAARMLMSSVRISLPAFEPAEVEKLLLALMAVDGPKWLPREQPGTFIYLRPTMIGTQSQLGVQAPSEAMFFIIASYMPVMDSPVGGMKLHTSPDDMVRAWVGGFGYAKVGANYGPSLLATQEARARGFGQILWLYGKQGECTEAGASNFFVVWKDKETGKTQLVTAPLDDRLILDGVTRRSVLQLVRERCGDEIEVVERKYTINEVLEADSEGRLVESFAAGTAVSPTPFLSAAVNIFFPFRLGTENHITIINAARLSSVAHPQTDQQVCLHHLLTSNL